MAFETNDFIEVSNIMLQIYDTMESEMLSKFSTRLSMNAKQGVANAYHDLQAHRMELQKIVERYTGDLDESYKDMIARAFVSGVAGADIDLGGQSEWDERGRTAFEIVGQFGRTRQTYVEGLARTLSSDMKGVITKAIRKENDIYRDIMVEIAKNSATGLYNRVQLTQQAINKFGRNKIMTFTDKSGKNWDIGTYAQMATRTTMVQAGLQGNLDRLQARGHDLIIVSQHARSCPLCRPWERQILSISGKTSGYRTISEAQSAGLWHPNCSHTSRAYIPGLTNTDAGEAKDKGQGTYEQQQEMRNCERHVRQWKKRLDTAITDQEKAICKRKINEWNKKANNLSKSTGIPRKYSNQQVTRIKDAPKRIKNPKLAKTQINNMKPNPFKVKGKSITRINSAVNKPKVEKPKIPPTPQPTQPKPKTPPKPAKPKKIKMNNSWNKYPDKSMGLRSAKEAFSTLMNESIEISKSPSMKRIAERYFNTLVDHIDDPTKVIPRSIKQLYLRFADTFKAEETFAKGGAFFRPSNQRVTWNCRKDLERKPGDQKPFSTFFHEFGHSLDTYFGRDLGKSMTNRISKTKIGKFDNTGMAIQKAIKKDYNDLLEEHSYDEISKMLIRDPKHYFVDEDGKKYYAHAHTAGIQDAMRGLSDGKIKTLWGHSLEYYKRKDMMNEVASETWANWLASYMTGDEEAQEMWQKMMPSTDATFKEIIEEILAQDV